MSERSAQSPSTTLEQPGLRTTPAIDPMHAEPRGLTVADLLAVMVGFAWGFSAVQPSIAIALQSDWSAFSSWELILLWVGVVVAIAKVGIVPAILFRQVRYCRMPFAAEWLAILVGVNSLNWFRYQIVAELFEWSFALAGLTGAFEREPTTGWLTPGPLAALAGLALVIAGAVLLCRNRRWAPIYRTLWICGLLVISYSLCVPSWAANAPWASQYDPTVWGILGRVRQTVWIQAPWTLPTSIAGMTAVLQRVRSRTLQSIWTERAALALLVVGLGSDLLEHFEIVQLLSVVILYVAGFGVSVGIVRLWRRDGA